LLSAKNSKTADILAAINVEIELRRRGVDPDAPVKVDKKLTYREWLPVVTPTFTWTWRQTEYIVKHIQKMLDGEIDKLMIFMPPRHTKSETVTVRLPAYILEHDDTQRIILGAYNQTLAKKFSRKTRKIAASRMKLSKERTAVEDWETETFGGLRAAGVGCGVTGMGANWVIIDDPVKNREEANSETYREKCWDWYTDDLYTRLEPKAKIILIMTRWHEDDLAGRILASEDGPNWTVINLPALAEKDDPLGREEGEALCPERYDVAALNKIRLVMGASFQALYQQRPSAEEGEIFKREWWKTYREVPKLKWVVLSWDTAFKAKQENDYCACGVWGYDGINHYLLDRWKQKVNYPELKRTAKALAQKWGPRAVLIEDKASGQSLIQELQVETSMPVVAIGVDTDKVTRAHAVTPTIEAGKVYLPESAPWLQDYIDEMASFPNGVNDDDVDQTTQYLNWSRKRGESAFSDLAAMIKAVGTNGHEWAQIGNGPTYQCRTWGIAVKVKQGQTPQEVADNHGWKECRKP
jgi:predicted phage terminase large subunit-like protein